MTDAAGHTTTSVYDAANRVTEVRYPAANGGTVSRFTYYDGLGRKIQEADEAGVNTTYMYDFRGLLTSVTLAAGTTQAVTTLYAYDELGNEIRQVDANEHVTTNRYDALGRRVARLLPGGQSDGYAYDRYTGNLSYQTNFNGVVITNQYDVANRLTNCSAPGYRTTYAYNPTGLRTNMTDASGVTAYGYNSLSQLTNKTVTWVGQSAVTLNYRYDALGSLTNVYSSTASGVSNAYQLDVLGRITNVLANGSSVAGYGFDLVGNLQTLRYGNGVTNLYQYDERNRLTNLVWQAGNTSLASFGYTLGPTGNRTNANETLNGVGRSYNWSYDYLYRLTSEGVQYLGTVNYQFDAVGNRTSRASTVSGIGNQTPIFNANDWLASDQYDANGNTTNSVSVAYQYDVMNHLTNVNSGTVVMTYDGDGNRVKKTMGGVTTYYLVDDRNPSGYVQVLEEYQGSSLSRVYNYGLALISQRQVSSGTVSYYGTDGHGSTRLLLNTSGSITDTYAYDAYGILFANTGSTPNNYLYCGQQNDSDLGMYYLRARYYKPDTGRFWTMDSYEGNNEDPLSLHKYQYCRANAVDRIDPKGLADYALRIIYAGVDTGTGFGILGDPETWGGGAAGVWYTLGDDFSKANIVVGPIGENDNIFNAVSEKVSKLNLKAGTDRVTKITFFGHGSGGYLGTWNNGSSAITLDSLQGKNSTPQLAMMKYLNPWTSGHCDVSLEACFQAVDENGKKMMTLMAQLLNANVIGFDDEVAIKGWGNQWTVDANGNWTEKKGTPFKGSWADVSSYGSIFSDFQQNINWGAF